MFPQSQATPLVTIEDEVTQKAGVQLYIKRDDLIHSFISGNKWRKLKYNLITAKKLGKECLLTFGGAFSNHIYALAAAAKEYNFQSIGIIRGEEHLPLNPTLDFATQQGMELHYVTRTVYRDKNESSFLEQLKEQFGDFYLIPEGGTNKLAAKGCEEIVPEISIEFDFICCAMGTGGTISGIIKSLNHNKKVIGFPALKGGDFLKEEIENLIGEEYRNYELQTDYHFGGYAKLKAEQVHFMKAFENQHKISLDPIYTSKMLFGIYDLMKKGYFPKNSKIVVVHTGGLQGIDGMREKMNKLLM